MPAAAIPALITAGGSIGAGLLGYKSAKAATKLSPAETQAQQQQTQAGQELGAQGRMLTAYGMPQLQQAGRYYSALASGNHATTAQAVAPEAAQINDVYGGTQRTLARFLRGPERDQQFGELARQRAGAIGSLFTGARERGVSGMVNLGQYGVGQGTSALQGAAGIAGQVGAQAANNRLTGAQLQGQAGASTAALIFQILQGYNNRSRGGAAPTVPVPYVPATSGLPMGLPGAVF